MVGVLAQRWMKNEKAKKEKLAKAAKQAKLMEKEKDLDCSKVEQRKENGKD